MGYTKQETGIKDKMFEYINNNKHINEWGTDVICTALLKDFLNSISDSEDEKYDKAYADGVNAVMENIHETEIALREFDSKVMKRQSNTFGHYHLQEWANANDRKLGYKGSMLSMFLRDIVNWLQQEKV